MSTKTLAESLANLGRVIETKPKPARPIPKECQARQFSDEMFCALCGLRYDVNEDEPPICPQDGRRARSFGGPGRA